MPHPDEPPDPARVLRGCPFFAELDDERISRLAALATTRHLRRSEIALRQDDAAPAMFVVATGLVRVYKLSPQGKEHVLHLVGPLQTFAEVAVVGDFPSPAFAEAVEDSWCVVLPAEPFRQLLRRDNDLCRQILASMAFWVKHVVDLLEDIVLRDAAGRVARYIRLAGEEQGASIRLPSLKKHLASHLNLTSETLSRTLRRLTEAGLIESAGGQVLRIIDPDGLEDAADGAFPRI